MIHFWTDRRPGEPDILAPLKDAALVVESTHAVGGDFGLIGSD